MCLTCKQELLDRFGNPLRMLNTIAQKITQHPEKPIAIYMVSDDGFEVRGFSEYRQVLKDAMDWLDNEEKEHNEQRAAIRDALGPELADLLMGGGDKAEPEDTPAPEQPKPEQGGEDEEWRRHV